MGYRETSSEKEQVITSRVVYVFADMDVRHGSAAISVTRRSENLRNESRKDGGH